MEEDLSPASGLFLPPLFLYPALNFTCCFCGGGAAIWSKLCSNVKYWCAGVRYLTKPRKNQHWKIHPCCRSFSPLWSVPQACPALSALGLSPSSPVTCPHCCLFPQEAVLLEHDPSGEDTLEWWTRKDLHQRFISLKPASSVRWEMYERTPTFLGGDTEPSFEKAYGKYCVNFKTLHKS